MNCILLKWKSHVAVMQNKNAPRLIRKFMRKHHGEKWELSLRSPKGCFFNQLLSPRV